MSRMYLLQINSNVHVGHLHLLFSMKNHIKPNTSIYLNNTLLLSLIPFTLTLYPKVSSNTHAKTIIDLGVWENI